MAGGQLESVLYQIRRLVSAPTGGGLTDRQLLERFANARDESAFATLVHRHGPLVLGVGGRILHNTHDAEDVFQATFMVLARKAHSLAWHASIRNWLYEVAYRLAIKARSAAARRHAQEAEAATLPRPESTNELAWRELCSVLDDELQGLPKKYREPLLLCYLEGQTTDQAARELGCSLRTLKRRLEQGRELMRHRLTRRGLTLSAAMLSAGLVEKASAVPAMLATRTVTSAFVCTSGTASGSIDAHVAELADGVLKGLTASRVKIVAAVFIFASLIAVTTGAAIIRGWRTEREDTEQVGREEPRVLAETRPVIVEEPAAPVDAKSTRNDLFGDPLPPGALARMGTVQWRHHQFGALGVAFSDDGKLVATTCDGVLKVWHASTGKIFWQLRGDEGFGAVHFSPNGKWLIADGKTLLDSNSGSVVRTISPGGYVLAFSQDSSLVATSARDGSVSICQTATGREIHHLPGNDRESTLTGIFTPDGRRLVNFVLLHNMAQKKLRASPEVQLRHLDMATGAQLKGIDLKIPRRRNLKFSPDAKTLAVVPYNRDPVSIWDTETGEQRCTLQGNPACAGYGLAFTRDSQTLATNWIEEGREETLISLWDANTGRSLRRFTVADRSVMSLRFAPDGRKLLTEGSGARIRFWDTQTGQPYTENPGHAGAVFHLSFAPIGSLLLSSAHDATIRAWHVATGRQLYEYNGPSRGVAAIGCLDGRTFLAAGNDDLIHVRDLETGKELRRFAVSTPVEQASPDSHLSTTFTLATNAGTIASKSAGGKAGVLIQQWDVHTGKAISSRTEDPTPQWALFSPDAKIMVGYLDTRQGALVPAAPKMAPMMKAGGSGLRYGNIQVVLQEVATGRRHLTLPQPDNYGHCAAFSPDGRTLMTSTYRVARLETGDNRQNHTLHLWELASGQERLTIKVGRDDWQYELEQIAFSPDGRTIAIARKDRIIQLLDVATSKEFLRHRGYDAPVYCMAFAPDGDALATGHSDSTILLWDASRASQRRAALSASAPSELEQLWTDLAGNDAHRAHTAIWAMASQPDIVPKFLRDRIRPAAAFDPDRLRQLIADLDSNRFQTREQAARQLTELEEQAEPALRESLKANPSPEQRRRIEALLAVPNVVRSPEKLRQLRAVEVLDHIGSAPALDVLATLAKGAPEARLTQEAKASVDRLRQWSARGSSRK